MGLSSLFRGRIRILRKPENLYKHLGRKDVNKQQTQPICALGPVRDQTGIEWLEASVFAIAPSLLPILQMRFDIVPHKFLKNLLLILSSLFSVLF